MSKVQKCALAIFSLLVCFIVCFHAWKSCTHEPTPQDQVDSLQVYIDQKKASADSSRNNSQIEKQKSDEAKKLYNSPANSSALEQLWTTIERDAKEDSSRKRAIR